MPNEESERMGRRMGRSVRDVTREAFVSGLAVVVPVVVTVLVLTVVLRSIYRYLDIFSDYLKGMSRIPIIPGVVDVSTETLIEILIPVALTLVILWVGLLVNSSRYGERAVDYFDAVIAAIPGVGSVYESFRQMSDVMLESDTQNFRDVKLVEFPREDTYTIGFVTTESPPPLRKPTGESELLTLFLPLAPNPVMGGHLVHVPPEKVIDVDMTVEEGVRAIVTSGVAVADPDSSEATLSESQLQRIARAETNGERLGADPGAAPDAAADRTEAYEAETREDRETPADFARKHRESDDSSGLEETPAERTRNGPDSTEDEGS